MRTKQRCTNADNVVRTSLDSTWLGSVLLIGLVWLLMGGYYHATGWDFTQFYVAAHVPTQSIHDQEVFQTTARKVLAGTGVTYASPYVRPAVFALPLRWMRGLSYWGAYRLWAGMQVCFYAATLWVLGRRLRVPVQGVYAWAVFFPACFGIIMGQDALAVGLVLVLGLAALEGGWDFAGGALLSLTLYKFNLFLLIPVYLVLQRRYKALAVYGLCGATLAGMSALLEPPSTYWALLPNIQRYTIGFSPSTMLGLRGLCSKIGWGDVYPVAATALAAYLLWASRKMSFALGFGMAVTASVLCAYHVTWYDGSVMALPLGLALARGGRGLRALARLLIIVPCWDDLSGSVSLLLIGFAVFYAVTMGNDSRSFRQPCPESNKE